MKKKKYAERHYWGLCTQKVAEGKVLQTKIPLFATEYMAKKNINAGQKVIRVNIIYPI